jgi:hypothetical protein
VGKSLLASPSINPVNTARAQQWFLTNAEVVVRVSLAALAVVLCYQFRWEFLRYITSELNLRVDALAGITMQRLSADTVLWKGAAYNYVNACTFVDVWCGAIPLVWDLRRTISVNLARLAVFSFVLFAFNVFRLSLSDMLFAAHVPWPLAHDVTAGFAYFAVWVWIWNHRTWALHQS